MAKVLVKIQAIQEKLIPLHKINYKYKTFTKENNNMTKKYQKPVIKIHEISNDYQILAGSGERTETINSNKPTDINKYAPQNGGLSNGQQDVGAKSNTFGVWDDDE